MKNNIEEDIKRCKKIITKKFNLDYSIDNVDKEAIENVLAEYRRLKQENEELTTNNFKQKNELEIKRREYQETYKDVRDELKELRTENEKKDKIINNAIDEVENIRQYFSDDLQPEFIRILEILKDKKVIDW